MTSTTDPATVLCGAGENGVEIVRTDLQSSRAQEDETVTLQGSYGHDIEGIAIANVQVAIAKDFDPRGATKRVTQELNGSAETTVNSAVGGESSIIRRAVAAAGAV